jgi:hypothetical protein
MFPKTKIALSVALVLGALGTSALASDHEDQIGGFQVQTWKDVEQSRQAIQQQIQRLYGTGNAAGAYAYSPSRNRHPVR